MTKKELEEKIVDQENQLNEIKEEHACLQVLHTSNGYNLSDNPFIPEYFGFTQTIHEEGDIVKARIYTRDGFNISRFVNVKDPRWVILSPTGVTNVVFIENMYTGLIVLRACGMNVTMEDYFEVSIAEQKKMDDKMEEIQEDSIDLLGGGRVL